MDGGMVSPSKFLTTPKSDYTVGNQQLIKDIVKSQGVTRRERTSLLLGKYKPLANKKFFVDVRNRVESSRLESTLKAYGAQIEWFLGQDVSFVITDKPFGSSHGQSPATSVSPIATPSPSSQLDHRQAENRSRTSAMLDKLSQQPSYPLANLVTLAEQWKIQVFSIPSFWKWIAKIRESVLAKVSEKRNRARELIKSEIVVDATDSAFIKIESSTGLDQPELLELQRWPRLHLNGVLGRCPFLSPSPLLVSSHPEEEREKSPDFEVKDKVTVELIKYDTDFRIRENIDVAETGTNDNKN